MRYLTSLYHRTPTAVFSVALVALLFVGYAIGQVQHARDCESYAKSYHLSECPRSIWNRFL